MSRLCTAELIVLLGAAALSASSPSRQGPEPRPASWSGVLQAIPSAVTLDRSPFVRLGEDSLDRDRDGLVDTAEARLARVFEPYLWFDAAEAARGPYEPIVVFQVHPGRTVLVGPKHDRYQLVPNPAATGALGILLRWVFLFRRDGGYGPSSWCPPDSHDGDNPNAEFGLVSRDGGKTWRISHASLGFFGRQGGLSSGTPTVSWSIGTVNWPLTSPIRAVGSHPVIYVSAHKHHMYFTTTYNHEDSAYSTWGCNDDVAGDGVKVVPTLWSLQTRPGYMNNVGESNYTGGMFVNSLTKYYAGYTAWDRRPFYSDKTSPNGASWIW